MNNSWRPILKSTRKGSFQSLWSKKQMPNGIATTRMDNWMLFKRESRTSLLHQAVQIHLQALVYQKKANKELMILDHHLLMHLMNLMAPKPSVKFPSKSFFRHLITYLLRSIIHYLSTKYHQLINKNQRLYLISFLVKTRTKKIVLLPIITSLIKRIK